MLILFNKPFNVLCQFTDKSGRATLADFVDVPRVYPAGLLDYDSEGLVVLTDDGRLQARIADPRFKLVKTYWVQVEGVPDEAALVQLRAGGWLKDKGDCRAAAVAAHAAGALSPVGADGVAGVVDSRGAQPAGATDDGGGGFADVAPGAGAGW